MNEKNTLFITLKKENLQNRPKYGKVVLKMRRKCKNCVDI